MTLTREKLEQLHVLFSETSKLLKRAAGKSFRALTVGSTGSKLSDKAIKIMNQTDKELRETWDRHISYIVRSVTPKIKKVKVKKPLKKMVDYDESLIDNFEMVDGYTLSPEDRDQLSDEIAETLAALQSALMKVLKQQQQVAYLLGLQKSQSSLSGGTLESQETELSESDLKALKIELQIQEEHLNKFIDRLKAKYDEFLSVPPGEQEPVYDSQQEIISDVSDVDTTSVHNLDVYAIAAIQAAIMAGTIGTMEAEGVNGGIWHTMHDGVVCEDCQELDGTWLSWHDFNQIYKNTLCNGNCRCGELFEPCNNTTDPYSPTQGKNEYYKCPDGAQGCIGSKPNLKVDSPLDLMKADMGAEPGSAACLMIQNAETATKKFYSTLSGIRQEVADRFSVSPKVDFKVLPHFFTPSSAQFRTGFYRALGKVNNKTMSIVNKEVDEVILTTEKEITSMSGEASTTLFRSGKRVYINVDRTPYSVTNDFLLEFGSMRYDKLSRSQLKTLKEFFEANGFVEDDLRTTYCKLFAETQQNPEVFEQLGGVSALFKSVEHPVVSWQIVNNKGRVLGEIDQFGELQSDDDDMKEIFKELLSRGIYHYTVTTKKITRERVTPTQGKKYLSALIFQLKTLGFTIKEKRDESTESATK